MEKPLKRIFLFRWHIEHNTRRNTFFIESQLVFVALYNYPTKKVRCFFLYQKTPRNKNYEKYIYKQYK